MRSRSHRPRWECILQYNMKAKYSSKSNSRMHSHAGAWERGSNDGIYNRKIK